MADLVCSFDVQIPNYPNPHLPDPKSQLTSFLKPKSDILYVFSALLQPTLSHAFYRIATQVRPKNSEAQPVRKSRVWCDALYHDCGLPNLSVKYLIPKYDQNHKPLLSCIIITEILSEPEIAFLKLDEEKQNKP